MALYLLDTNTLANLIKNPQGRVADRVKVIGPEDICTSIIVACEIVYGIELKQSARLTENVEAIMSNLKIYPFASPAEVHYGQLRAELKRQGKPIGPNDLLIAAHALALDAILVTDNSSEFMRVAGLKTENWLR